MAIKVHLYEPSVNPARYTQFTALCGRVQKPRRLQQHGKVEEVTCRLLQANHRSQSRPETGGLINSHSSSPARDGDNQILNDRYKRCGLVLNNDSSVLDGILAPRFAGLPAAGIIAERCGCRATKSTPPGKGRRCWQRGADMLDTPRAPLGMPPSRLRIDARHQTMRERSSETLIKRTELVKSKRAIASTNCQRRENRL